GHEAGVDHGGRGCDRAGHDHQGHVLSYGGNESGPESHLPVWLRLRTVPSATAAELHVECAFAPMPRMSLRVADDDGAKLRLGQAAGYARLQDASSGSFE